MSFNNPSRVYLLCVDHVIWTGYQILKLASNFEMFIKFFVFCRIEKDKLLCNSLIEITKPFLYLVSRCLKISQQIKQTQQKSFNIRHQFQQSTPGPNDMIQAIWEHVVIKTKVGN